MSGKSPQQIYSENYQSNPQFRELADSVSGMTPQEAFQSKGYDFGQTMQSLTQEIPGIGQWR